MKYISIMDGSEYEGNIPDSVTAFFSVRGENIFKTSSETARLGSNRYPVVLDKWMLERGYIREDKIRLSEKGGPGSGHFDHAGRPGLVGGSVPKDSAVAGDGDADAQKRYGKLKNQAAPAKLTNDEMDRIREIESPWKYDSELNKLIIGDFANTYSFYEKTALERNKVEELSRKTGIPRNRVLLYVAEWTSSSNRGVVSPQLQRAASEEFGVDLSEWQLDEYKKRDADIIRRVQDVYHAINVLKRSESLEHLSIQRADSVLRYWGLEGIDVKKDWTHEDVYAIVKDAKSNNTYVNEMRIFLRQVYSDTQAYFSSKGYDPDDKITLFRGVFDLYDTETIAKYTGNAMESWSTDPAIAKYFKNILAISVPVRNILSIPVIGFGSHSEMEAVILGNNDIEVFSTGIHEV